MPHYQYFNGQIYPIDIPLFKATDLGLLRGYGIFDYFRTHNGVPFRWDDYWQRFENSARLLQLELPINKQEATTILADLHRKSGEAEVAYRFLLTGGYATDSVTVLSPNLLMRTEAISADNNAARTKGIKVLPYDYVRDLPEIKSTHYIHMILMAEEMKKHQAADLLYHKNGAVSELTRSNIFIIKEDTLITPGQHVLHGITRRVLMELAAPHLDVQVRPVSLEELLQADEVFTTSSTKFVMPVVQVGDQLIGKGMLGKHTTYLQQLFHQLTAGWGK
ncbi:MAG: aminotransferase class IV [Williamsia sp.]|nr:aminotransferase class IV [Williamsia sp.]